MTTQVRTLNFLPEIFQTELNKQFLSATLDTLTSQPDLVRVQGFIGDKSGYAVQATDKYISEISQTRANYQFDPSVVFLKKDTQTATDFINYPGIVDALTAAGATTDNHNSLFSNKFYSWDSFVDLDKIVNYAQYYWLPLGPDAILIDVDIDTADIIGQSTYTVASGNAMGMTLVNGLKIMFTGDSVTPATSKFVEYYVDGVGTSIELIKASDLTVTEIYAGGIYTPWDAERWDTGDWSIRLNVPINPDYIVANRRSSDRNAWARGNRWFHQSVIDATYKYNNGVITANEYNTQTRAQRPIIEFEPDLALFNSGSKFGAIVDFIDNTETNAFQAVAGSSSFTITNTYTTSTGTTITSTVSPQDGAIVVFAADTNINVRQTAYRVKKYKAGTTDTVITLEPVIGVTIEDGSQIYIKNGPGEGSFGRGATLRWSDTDTDWITSQTKTTINQKPLFDVFDVNNISLGDTSKYEIVDSATKFKGTYLFSYTVGTGSVDDVLSMQLAYTGSSSTGDYLFTVNLNSDTFTYKDPSTLIAYPDTKVSIGYIHHNNPVTGAVTKRNGWVEAAADSKQYQVFVVDITSDNTNNVEVDVVASQEASTTWAPTQVFHNGEFVNQDEYLVLRGTSSTKFLFNTDLAVGDQVSISVLSDQVSSTGYYQIPSNLLSNPFNTEITSVAAGDIKNFYTSIFSNAPGATGNVYGSNNLNTLGAIAKYGTTIIQNSSSLVLPGVFLRKSEYNLATALQYSCDEYMDYKHTMLDLAQSGDYSVYQTAAQILDDIIYQISSTKNESDSFFWSDMLCSGSPYATKSYNFNATVTNTVFSLTQTYDYASANYHGVAIYLTRTTNGQTTTTQLVRGIDYTVSSVETSVTVHKTLTFGDIVSVSEYRQTYGSYVPNTPTKLGLYPASVPKIILDTSYNTPTYFIVGHDGSQNRLFGDYNDGQLNDFRDIVLLEFETRVYNNIKTSNAPALTHADLFPGQFRTTDYTWEQILPAFTTNFLRWTGKNRIDFRRQLYSRANPFSFNYNKSTTKKVGTQAGKMLKQGGWRGVYRWFYDTVNPAATPWEMLGFTDKPAYWDSKYGASPYTSGNTLMWSDIEAGKVYDTTGTTASIDSRYVRTGLLSVLPVDAGGNLLPPLATVVDNYDSNTFQRDWLSGDCGAAEASYLRSSTYPFDLMNLLSIFLPAKFYNQNVDTDKYKYNSTIKQWLFNERYHLVPSELEIYGTDDTTAKHSYINWIVDYINRTGADGASSVSTTLKNLDVRLTYKLAGYSDKEYLRFLTENSSPNSSAASLLIPDDNYEVLLYDNVATDKITYSSVIIQRTTSGGFTVWGNSTTNPYFTTVSPSTGPQEKIKVGTVSVDLSTVYDADSRVSVAYGTEFYTMTGVSEFLRNYGRYLTERGVKFENNRAGLLLDYGTAMVQEFLNWAQQNWQAGSTINLNPNATKMSVGKTGLIAQSLTLKDRSFVLNQNLRPIQNQNMAVVRDNETLTISVLSEGDTIAFTSMTLSAMEHAVVFDNTTIFGDILYDKTTGLRQRRLILQGKKSANWTGQVSADGFIINQGDIEEWTSSKKYAKGQIVTYKNLYWAAKQLVEPAVDFDYTQWTQSSYDSIKQGLLANPSTSAYESTNFYNIQDANLERDQDLLAFGLIGYRPRAYMVDAALTDTAQINLYNSMIQIKGTNLASVAFKGATPLQGALDYDVYENWAVKTGDFGSTLNSNFVEVKLKQDSLTSNPSIIEFTDSATTSTAQQRIIVDPNINELLNYGIKPTTAKFLPLNTTAYAEQRGLPSAGYVNINDVKFTAYNFYDLNLSTDAINNLYRGDVVWVANHMGRWDVFTPVSLGVTLSTVTNNLNGTITLTFSAQHGLEADDPIYITDFDTAINGYYLVGAVKGLTSVTVTSSLSKSRVKVLGTGVAFKLVSRRSASASAVSTEQYGAFSTRLNWVDEDKSGKWQVLAASPSYKLDADTSGASGYGRAIAYSAELGTVIADDTTVKIGTHTTAITGIIQLLAIKDTLYAATASEVHIISDLNLQTVSTQFAIEPSSQSTPYDASGENIQDVNEEDPFESARITAIAAEDELGMPTAIKSFAVSTDGRWMYIATNNTVTAYHFNGTTYVTTGYSVTGDEVGALFGASIATTRDGSKLVVGAPDEDINGVNRAGAAYIYNRASVTLIQTTQGNTTFSNIADTTLSGINIPLSADVYINNTLAAATVTASSGKVSVTFTTAPEDGDTIVVNYGELTLQQKTTSDSPHNGGNYGRSVATNRAGAEIIVGAPYELDEVDGVRNVEGAVYRWTNSGQRYGSVVTKIITDAMLASINYLSFFIDGYYVSIDSASTVEALAVQINLQEPTNIIATVVDVVEVNNNVTTTGKGLSLSSVSNTPNIPYDEIDITGSATDLAKLGIISYTQTQVIYNPDLGSNTGFGSRVALNAADCLAVSAPTTFALSEAQFDYTDDLDDNDTIFDNGATTFVDSVANAGAVYVYDYLEGESPSITDSGKFVFGQYCSLTDDVGMNTHARLGQQLVNSDGAIIAASSTWYSNGNGRVTAFKTAKNSSWYTAATSVDTVDINKLHSISIYDTTTNTTIENLDFINPTQGALLSVVDTNLDFISQTDPATYSHGQVWFKNKVGTTWLDTTNLRMLDATQPAAKFNDDKSMKYNASVWGKAFPGSTADIYTWIESSVAPLNYSGNGYPVSYTNYTRAQVIDKSSNAVVNMYYFWVKNYGSVPAGKTLSPRTLAQYILDPLSSGIPFLAAINTSTVALFNAQDAIRGNDSALHIGFGSASTDDHAHQDWTLLRDGEENDFLAGVPTSLSETETPSSLYLKYINSFMGADMVANTVPDETLPELVKYGVSFRPRQSMFSDRLGALKNFIQYANEVAAANTITETRGTFLLYKTAAATDLFAAYDVSEYITITDWWATGYSSNTKVTIEVATKTDLLTIGSSNSLNIGSSGIILGLTNGLVARVAKNGQGLQETYVYDTTNGWTRVGLERGTVQLNSTLYTDSTVNPMIIYWVIRWITEQLFVDELAYHNNASLMMMFKLVQSQSPQHQNYLNWLNKTSLLDVKHTIRQLVQYKKYQRDSTELVTGYLNEVKPFHVYIKEFSFLYKGTDTYEGAFTDFDLQPQYNSTTGKFESPQLVYSGATTGQYLPNNAIWSTTTYSDWYNYYGLSFNNEQVDAIEVTSLATPVTTSSIEIVLAESGSMPARGTIQIGNEQMSYGSIDRYTNTLSDIVRNTNSVGAANYPASSIVSLIPEAVMVMNGARGYTTAPTITATIDTTEFPYPVRQAAEFVPTIKNGQLTTVTVLTAGSGYPVQPTFTVSSSDISTKFSSDQVDPVINQIQIPSHSFINGDSVIVTELTSDTTNIVANKYYYVGKIDNNNIALYEHYRDSHEGYTSTSTAFSFLPGLLPRTIQLTHTFIAGNQPFNTGDRVKIVYGASPSKFTYYYVGRKGMSYNSSTDIIGTVELALYTTYDDAIEGDYATKGVSALGSGTISLKARTDTRRLVLKDATDGKIAITAQVRGFMNNNPTRQMKVAMKFDRTSYRPQITQWSSSVTYSTNSLVLYTLTTGDSFVYRRNSQPDQRVDKTTFDLTYWDEVTSRDTQLNGLDRIAGYYKPSSTMPSYSLGIDKLDSDVSQLVTGSTYPSTVVTDLPFNDSGKTYVFTPKDVNTANNTIKLSQTKQLSTTYSEVIYSSYQSNGVSLLAVTSTPIAKSSNATSGIITLSTTDGIYENSEIKFVGLTLNDGLTNKLSYIVDNVYPANNSITIKHANGSPVTMLNDRANANSVVSEGYSPVLLNVTTTRTAGMSYANVVNTDTSAVANVNRLAISNIDGIVANTTVKFIGSTTGYANIVADRYYFVRDVFSTDSGNLATSANSNVVIPANTISISETPGGDAIVLSNNNGQMTAVFNEPYARVTNISSGTVTMITNASIIRTNSVSNIAINDNVRLNFAGNITGNNKQVFYTTSSNATAHTFVTTDTIGGNSVSVSMGTDYANMYVVFGSYTSPVATEFVSGDKISSIYTLPENITTPYSYAHVVDDNLITLHTDLSQSITGFKPITVPSNSYGQMIRPKTILTLTGYAGNNTIDSSIIPVTFEHSTTSTRFGLIVDKHYFLKVFANSSYAAVYNSENDAVEDYNRIQLLTQTGGQLTTLNYDSVIRPQEFFDDTTSTYNVVGSTFNDGYGPEELVAGVVTDGLNFTVTTRPGATWDALMSVRGATDDIVYGNTGFNKVRLSAKVLVNGVASFANSVANPVTVMVYADTSGGQYRLTPDVDYTINWITQEVKVIKSDIVQVDILVFEFGNGSQIVRSNSNILPVRTVAATSTTQAHSEILLDVPYSELELPSAINSFLSAMVFVGSSTSDTARITYIDDKNNTLYSSTGHFNIEPQRSYDPVNDPFNPAKIVFSELYSSTDYITFSLSTNVVGMYTISDSVKLDYLAPVVDVTTTVNFKDAISLFFYIQDKTHVYINDEWVSTDVYSFDIINHETPVYDENGVVVDYVTANDLNLRDVLKAGQAFLKVTFNDGAIKVGDTVKIAYGTSGVGVPETQWFKSTTGTEVATNRVRFPLDNFIKDGNYSAMSEVEIVNDTGKFGCSSTILMKVGDRVTISGATIASATGKIFGYTHSGPNTSLNRERWDSKTYYIAETNGFTGFTLTSYFGGDPDITTEAGTLDGLTFSIENNLLIEIDGVRQDGPAPKEIFYKIVSQVGEAMYLSYPAPVYGLAEFNVTYLKVQINGEVIPQVTGSTVNWNVNFDPVANEFYKLDADFVNEASPTPWDATAAYAIGIKVIYNSVCYITKAPVNATTLPTVNTAPDMTPLVWDVSAYPSDTATNLWGFFDDGTPFDNQLSFNVVLNAATDPANPDGLPRVLKQNDIVSISYEVPPAAGALQPEVYVISERLSDAGALTGHYDLYITYPFTSGTGNQIAITSYNRTTQLNLKTQRITDAIVTKISGFTHDGSSAPLVTTSTSHDLFSGYKVIINGTYLPKVDGRTFYVERVDSYTFKLFNDSNLSEYDTTPRYPTAGTSYVQLINSYRSTTDTTLSINPLVIDQPVTFMYEDTSRFFVSLVNEKTGASVYVHPDNMKVVRIDGVISLVILQPVVSGDKVLVTSMVPGNDPNETRFRINQTWNSTGNRPNEPVIYRENQFSRTYVSAVTETDGVATEITVKNPLALVTKTVSTVNVEYDTAFYAIVTGVVNSQMVYSGVKYNGIAMTDYSVTSVDNNNTMRVNFNSGFTVKPATFTGSITGSTLTVTGTVEGTIAVGQLLSGDLITDNIYITAGSGTTWTVKIGSTLATATGTVNNIVSSTMKSNQRVEVTVATGNQVIINGGQLQYTSLSLDTGLISGITYSKNTTIAPTINVYDEVQSVLVENRFAAGLNTKSFYDNIVTATVDNANTTSGTYVFKTNSTTDINGYTTTSGIVSVKAGDKISFGSIQGTTYSSSNASSTIANTTVAYSGKINFVNTGNTSFASLAKAGDTISFNYANAVIYEFQTQTADRLAEFTVIDSYENKANSSQWTIQVAEPVKVVSGMTANIHIAEYTVDSIAKISWDEDANTSTAGIDAYEVKITTSAGLPAVTNGFDVARINKKTYDMPLQLDSSAGALFLKQQTKP